MSDLQREKFSRKHHQGRDTAVHEAGHVVAQWIQGVPFQKVFMNDRGAPWYDSKLDDLDAMVQGDHVGEFGNSQWKDGREVKTSILQGTAEGYVRGCQQAFITLAGAIAQAQYLNYGDAPLTLRMHADEARSKLWFFSGIDGQENGNECERILHLVVRTFGDERVKRTVLTVAGVLYKYRYLEYEQCLAVIEAGWNNEKFTIIHPTYKDQQ